MNIVYKGYELGNIQWITHSENSRKATINRYYEHTRPSRRRLSL